MQKVLVATGNPGKVREYRDMLNDLALEWLSLKDVGLDQMEVEETGSTFAENAILKARAYHAASGGLLTLADDSGLEVFALNGAPGVYSARYGAPEVSTEQGRYQKLLATLADIPAEGRGARFVCVIAILAAGQEVMTVEGHLEGSIGWEARGSHGFGYDPVFVMPDGRHLAELLPEEKNPISHRGVALQKALPLLRQILVP
jgi:XTP/dITP diphosphohydrolase